ncbi:alpha/beta hydrolase [Vibrio maerlii]|uniref:alpha/beta hydrolase n=1 Tax=Vibrio maerlii TaxID=2231648 RepID=UPI000E3B6BB9|nr:alpha/beta fold hydrolase [Vibrio maerlii]
MYKSIALICIVLSGVFAFGPRVQVEHHIKPQATSPQAFLSSEVASLGIIDGTEKRILMQDDSVEKTPYSVVYLHGFSSSRQELAPVPEWVANRLGANLIETRLSGHGRDSDAMGEPNVEDWLSDAAEACQLAKQLGEQVVLIGTSTGGTLAVWLGSQPWCSESLAAIILVSPNFGPKDTNSEMLLLPWGEQLARSVVGKYRGFKPRNDLHAKYWTETYHSRALVTMMGTVETTRRLLDHVEVPVLTLYSPKDRVVDTELILYHANRMTNPNNQITPFEHSKDYVQHLLAGDILSPSSNQKLTDVIVDYLKGLNR